VLEGFIAQFGDLGAARVAANKDGNDGAISYTPDQMCRQTHAAACIDAD
jgi:hypothetical protein